MAGRGSNQPSIEKQAFEFFRPRVTSTSSYILMLRGISTLQDDDRPPLMMQSMHGHRMKSTVASAPLVVEWTVLYMWVDRPVLYTYYQYETNLISCTLRRPWSHRGNHESMTNSSMTMGADARSARNGLPSQLCTQSRSESSHQPWTIRYVDELAAAQQRALPPVEQ